MDFLTAQQIEKSSMRKKVKTMRTLLLMGMLIAAFVSFSALAYATGTTDQVTTDSTYAIHEVININAYGVEMNGNRKATTTTTTSRVWVDENGQPHRQTSTTVDYAETTEEWLGGSLKARTTTGTTISEAQDGSRSLTTYTDTTYYDASGRISGGSYSSHTDGYNGSDFAGSKIGYYASDTNQSSTVEHGQRVPGDAVTRTTFYDASGDIVTGHAYSVTHFTTAYIDGKVVVTGETTNSFRKDNDQSWTSSTQTKTYQRDSVTGLVTGVSLTGHEVSYTATGDHAGTYSDITITGTQDSNSKVGYYIKTITRDGTGSLSSCPDTTGLLTESQLPYGWGNVVTLNPDKASNPENYKPGWGAPFPTVTTTPLTTVLPQGGGGGPSGPAAPTDYSAQISALYAGLPGYNMNDPNLQGYIAFWNGQAQANGGFNYVNTAFNNILGPTTATGQRNANWQDNLGESFTNTHTNNGDVANGWATLGLRAQNGITYTP